MRAKGFASLLAPAALVVKNLKRFLSTRTWHF